MELNRKIHPQEEKLLIFLISKSSVKIPSNWKENFLVRSMQDGKMGGLYLFPNGTLNEKRMLGRTVSEYQFKDKDGIDVIASLNLDEKGDLFELDIWKTDFSPLISFPELPN